MSDIRSLLAGEPWTAAEFRAVLEMAATLPLPPPRTIGEVTVAPAYQNIISVVSMTYPPGRAEQLVVRCACILDFLAANARELILAGAMSHVTPTLIDMHPEFADRLVTCRILDTADGITLDIAVPQWRESLVSNSGSTSSN